MPQAGVRLLKRHSKLREGALSSEKTWLQRMPVFLRVSRLPWARVKILRKIPLFLEIWCRKAGLSEDRGEKFRELGCE